MHQIVNYWRTKMDKEKEQCICHRCIKEYDLRDEGSLFPLNLTQMITCPKCHSKRCGRAYDHDAACDFEQAVCKDSSTTPFHKTFIPPLNAEVLFALIEKWEKDGEHPQTEDGSPDAMLQNASDHGKRQGINRCAKDLKEVIKLFC